MTVFIDEAAVEKIDFEDEVIKCSNPVEVGATEHTVGGSNWKLVGQTVYQLHRKFRSCWPAQKAIDSHASYRYQPDIEMLPL